MEGFVRNIMIRFLMRRFPVRPGMTDKKRYGPEMLHRKNHNHEARQQQHERLSGKVGIS